MNSVFNKPSKVKFTEDVIHRPIQTLKVQENKRRLQYTCLLKTGRFLKKSRDKDKN